MKNNKRIILYVIIAVVVIGLGVYFYNKGAKKNNIIDDSSIDPNRQRAQGYMFPEHIVSGEKNPVHYEAGKTKSQITSIDFDKKVIKMASQFNDCMGLLIGGADPTRVCENAVDVWIVENARTNMGQSWQPEYTMGLEEAIWYGCRKWIAVQFYY